MNSDLPKGASMTEQDWINAGYQRFNQSYRGSNYLLQKCIKDSTGKRYFIDICVYDWKEYRPREPSLPEFSFEPLVQFQNRDGDKPTMNVSLILSRSDTIAQIEEDFNQIWVSLGKPYYEKWDD